jgi:hypothetical protein
MIDLLLGNVDYPMHFSAKMSEMETNVEMLKSFRTWLFLSPVEREIFEDDYPELAWLGDDMLIKDMRNEIWSALN